MTDRLLRSLVRRLFPGPWRRRYGDEFEALLDDTGATLGVVADVVRLALRLRVSTHRRGLWRLAAAAGFVLAEWLASTGYSDNVLWVPRSLVGGGLLAAAVGCFAVAVGPTAVRAGRWSARQVRSR